MAYHISKEQNVLGTTRIIYFVGDNAWTTEYDERKTYTNKTTAKGELYSFGGSAGTVVTE